MNIRNAFAALALASIGAFAALPTTMLFQGNLAVDGTAKTGTTKLVVALYDAPASGTKVWEETFTGVALVNGSFAVQLGASKALPAFAKPLYVQLTADGKVAATRVPLTLAPYAAMAGAIPNVRSSGDTTYLDASTVKLGPANRIVSSTEAGASSKLASIDVTTAEENSELELRAEKKTSTYTGQGRVRMTDSLVVLGVMRNIESAKTGLGSNIHINLQTIEASTDTLKLTRAGSVLAAPMVASPMVRLTPAHTQGADSNIPVCDATTQGTIIYVASYQGGASSFKGCVYLGAGTGTRFMWQTLNGN